MSCTRSITAVLAAAGARLGAASGSPMLDAELLLARVMGLTRAQLLARGDQELPPDVRLGFEQLAARRRRGEPLAYILGTKDFWSLTLEVEPAVLVPRPETELLVELALAAGDAQAAGDALSTENENAPAPPRRTHVADLGTGSGAIALAIAVERPSWKVIATDSSSTALAVARRNARRHGLERVELVHGDWLQPLAGRKLDVIVSNPPYLAADDPALAQPALCFEPQAALTDGADGLTQLLHIARAARAQLFDGGTLLLEHAPDQGARLRAELVALGYRHVRSHRDLAGRERATEARHP